MQSSKLIIRNIFSILVFSITSFTSININADVLLAAFQPAKPPFIIPNPPYDSHDLAIDSKGLGIQIDIARAAMKVRGHTFKHVFLSEKRQNHELKSGNVDMAFDVRKTFKNRNYSNEKFSHYENSFITLSSNTKSIQSFSDLSDISFVTWEGASNDLGPSFAKQVSNNPGYIEMPDSRKLKLFLSGRVEGLLIDINIFKWYYLNEYKGKKGLDHFRYNNVKELKPRGGYAGFISQSLRDDFDFGMKTIRNNGEYKRISDSYFK